MHPTLALLVESEAIPAGAKSNQTKDKLLDCPDFSPVENSHLRPRVTASSFDLHHALASQVLDGACPPSTSPNPFALKATNEDSFGPRRQVKASDEPPESKGSQFSVLESDDVPVLTETSEEEPSPSQLSTTMSVRLRSTILTATLQRICLPMKKILPIQGHNRG